MNPISLLRTIMQDPRARGLDLDSAEATAAHERIITEKPFLRRLYASFYADFAEVAARAPGGGLMLEIGAGSGFMEEVVPGVKTLDVRPGARVDLCASALELPLADGSVSCLFMLDVLHHLPALDAFFAEARRVLRPGGRVVMTEPFNSALARPVYKHLHHEAFDETWPEWALATEGGPLTSSNQALPWIVFVRDRARFESRYPELQIDRIEPHTILLYLLSGGLSMRQVVPNALFTPLRRVEQALLPRLGRQLATMMTIELVRSNQ